MWRQIPDNQVRHVWHCRECGADVQVRPDFYVTYGTPVCQTCDSDMYYEHTLIEEETSDA